MGCRAELLPSLCRSVEARGVSTGAALGIDDMPVVVNYSCPDGSDCAENCGGFCTVAVLLVVIDVPVVLVVLAPQLHVETAVITSLQVVEYSSPYGGSGEDGAFRPFYGHFSHSVLLDVECRVAGTPGACSWVFCHPN